jgi:hypothetical protein
MPSKNRHKTFIVPKNCSGDLLSPKLIVKERRFPLARRSLAKEANRRGRFGNRPSLLITGWAQFLSTLYLPGPMKRMLTSKIDISKAGSFV